jgi:hypothetical protein
MMADSGGTIAGRVHLPDGTPIVEARVSIASGPVPTPDVALLTDGEGRFRLHVPTSGHYEVACHADGMAPASVRVAISSDVSSIDVDLEMTKDLD